MAKQPAPAAKSSAKAKKPKVKKERFARTKQIIQAYKVIKPQDLKLPYWMVLAGVGAAAVIYAVLLLISGNFYIPIPIALMFGVLGALFIFSVRARRSTYAQAEGKPGAAAWAMGNMRGDWRVTESVAGNAQADLVHRVIGRPGVVLVAEGSPQRVKTLLAQEKKRLSRVVGDTPIYDVIVGDGEGLIPLKKLDKYVMKLPRNIQGAQIRTLDKRLKAVGAPKMPVPQGPMPKGKQMEVNARALRRRG